MLTYSHHIFIKYEVHLTELCRVLLKLSSTIFLNECLPSSQKRENILISSFLQYTGDAFDRSDTSRFLFSQIIFAVISRLTDVCLLQIFFKLLFSHYLFDWLEKNLHLSNYYCSTLRIVNWGGLLRLFKDDSTSSQCLKTTKLKKFGHLCVLMRALIGKIWKREKAILKLTVSHQMANSRQKY